MMLSHPIAKNGGVAITNKIPKNEIRFDSNDWGAMLKLCEEHEKYPEPLFGKTASNEDFMIEVLPDRIITHVFQENGWVRKNAYFPQELFSEELFEGKWKSGEQRPKKHSSIER